MYSFRPITNADYDFLYQLHRATLRPYVEATWQWDEAQQAERFRQKFEQQNRQIIQIEGQDVGVLILEERPNELFLSLIEIDPSYQNQGIGSAIVRNLITQAHGQGQPLTLTVLKANVPAYRLYQRLGFRTTAETTTHFQMTNPLPAELDSRHEWR